MANLNKLLLAGQFPPGNNSLNHFDKLFGQALFGGVEKTVDFSPIISVSDALAKPAIDLQCKITAVQEGSGDPSPTNIRNIVGFSGLSLYQTDGTAKAYNASSTTALSYGVSVNVLSSTAFEMTNTGSTQYPASKQLLSFLGLVNGKTYTIYAYIDIKKITTKNVLFGIRNASNSFVSGKVTQVYNVLPEGEDKGLIALRFTYNSSTDNYLSLAQIKPSAYAEELDIVLSQIKVLEDTTSDTPTEILISWQDEAGTIYGGILNFTTGLLTVTHAIINLYTVNWSYLESGAYFVANISGKKATNFDVVCDSYKTTTSTSVANMQNLEIKGSASNNAIYIKNSAYTNAVAFRNSLNGVMCVYSLATPETYQLTPQAVQLLAGNNTLWNTAGDTALTYMAKR